MTQTMNTVYTVAGANTFISTRNPDADLDKLPVGVYQVCYSQDLGFYLSMQSLPATPKKFYDSPIVRAKRIINTYKDRNKSTGVMLSGLRGTGKSLLSQVIAQEGLAMGFPVIMITNQYHGGDFSKFMNQIKQQVIVIIDEYEKVYHEPDAENCLLTLLDGTGTINALWVLTVNEVDNISKYLKNRPSRIHYNFKYGTLPKDIVKQIFKDQNVSDSVLDELDETYLLFKEWTYDVAISLAKETKRYGIGLVDAARDMSIDVLDPMKEIQHGTLTMFFNGEAIASKSVYHETPAYFNNSQFESHTISNVDTMRKVLLKHPKYEQHTDYGEKLIACATDEDLRSFFRLYGISFRFKYAGVSRTNGAFYYTSDFFSDVMFEFTEGFSIKNLSVF